MTEWRGSTIRIAVSPSPEPVVVTVAGHLDIDSAADFRGAFESLLGRSVTRIIVDLAGLEFCDSIGLSALIDTQRECERRGGYLRLAAPTAFLLRVLGVVGLLGKLTVYDSVEDARADRPPGARAPSAAPDPKR